MQIRKTDDGSETLWSEQYKETYHSTFGAITESEHVFIEAGFNMVNANSVHIFEMGFGTGLNALLTCLAARKLNKHIVYHAIELHPVSLDIVSGLNAPMDSQDMFRKLHESEWNKEIALTSMFHLKKIRCSLQDWQPDSTYNLVYYDAFSPETQPELWTKEIFDKIYQMLNLGGILTTYCAKGYVRRNLVAAGFKVERLPGPPGKREMLRGRKE